MKSMKAVRIHSFGNSQVLNLEDAPRPEPGAGEVLIRIHATSVNPFDCALRMGYMAGMIPSKFPLILGTDVSGVIEEVGDGVSGFKKGDEVFARAGVYRDGSYAEFATVAASDVAFKPSSIDHIQAAAAPHVTLTAWQALFEAADLKKGQTVLIHGAAGGVGHIATQLAKQRGARVIGTASVNLAYLKEFGVDEAIDYATTPFESVAHDVDVVLDTMGGDVQERSWSTLKPGGMLVSTIQPPSEATAASHGVRSHFVTSTPPIGKTLTEVARMIDGGLIKPKVSRVLPLSEVRKAHEQVEGKHTLGKLVLQVAQ